MMRRTRCLPTLALVSLLAASAPAQLADDAFVDSFVDLGDALHDIGRMLPERPNAGAPFLSADLAGTFLVESDTTVTVTFAGETSHWRNTLGVFTWDGADPPTVLDRQLVFPDASLDVLQPGDTVTLRDALGEPRIFAAGTHLGFFMVADGRKSKDVKKWEATTALIPHDTAASNAAVGKGLATTVDALNPETAHGRADLARRAALVHTPFLLDDAVPTFVLGFESHHRTDARSDHDFNDVVVVVRGAGLEASGDALTMASVHADPDGDGILGTDDAFPEDAARAQVRRVPSRGFTLLALDHGYPEAGDGDFADAVLAMAFDVVTDADGAVKEILGHFHLLARTLGTSDRFGLHMPGLPGDSSGLIQVERFLGDDAVTHQIEAVLRIEDVVVLGRRIEILLNSTSAALPPADTAFGVNNESTLVQRPAASVRMLMTFDAAVDAEDLGPPPFDPYWMVSTSEGEADVHNAGVAGFLLRPPGLPDEAGDDAFLASTGWPWSLVLPAPARFPLQDVAVNTVYPWLVPWAASRGVKKPNWPDKISSKKASLPVEAYLESRPWTIGLPTP